jgi:ribonuclease PH
VLVEMGNTKVLCTASVEEKVPPFLKGKGRAGSPRSTACCRAPPTRAARARRPRQAVGPHAGDPAPHRPQPARRDRPAALGERQITIDCDVLQADGGTRCASITGAMVALADAVAGCAQGAHRGDPLRDFVAAVSVGIVDGEPMLDLDYARTRAATPT